MSKISFTEHTKELQDAIRKLEAFSKQASNKAPISNPIATIKSLLRKAFDANVKKVDASASPDQEEVLRAAEFVASRRLHIQKLRRGNSAEQMLAESFLKAIDNYNKSRDKQLEQETLQQKGLPTFLPKRKMACRALPKIDLPEQFTVNYLFPAAKQPTAQEIKESKHTFTAAVSLPKQSAELFQMKVLALLERYGIASSYEVRSIVKQSPIITEMLDHSSTCTLKQTLTLFPGQTVVVMASSELDPKTQTVHKLFPETFSVSLESTQTGFPHPSQRAGWTLANQLLPESPQRIDLLPTLGTFFQKKKAVVQDLLPKGALIDKAKALLRQKKNAFTPNQKELLTLHHQLIHTLIRSSKQALRHTGALVDAFFEELQANPQAFDILNEVNYTIREYAITKPYQLLLDAILKSKGTGLLSPDPSVRYEAASRLMDQAFQVSQEELSTFSKASDPQSSLKWDYTQQMSQIIGNASKAIILQYLSEDLVFEPPGLSPFACQLQLLAYTHVADFLVELSQPLATGEHQQESMRQLLATQIRNDISLFQGDATQASIPKELSSYFQQRYLSLVEHL